MSIVDLQSRVLLTQSKEIEAFTQAVARISAEVKFMKDLIEISHIGDDAKVVILSNFVRIFELSFKSMAAYYAVAYKEAVDQDAALYSAADGKENSSLSPFINVPERSGHGN